MSLVSVTLQLDRRDYVTVNVFITIPEEAQNGQSYCYSVSIIDDELLENTEQFFLDLNSSSPDVLNIEESRGTKTIFITDNERKCPALQRHCCNT